jgi:hypothetical protein
MRLAMVIGEQRLALEQRMLNRLAVGLMAEGVQIARVIPKGLPPTMLAEGERRMALAPRFEAHLKSLPWMRRVHVRKAAEALEDSPPDVLYLCGRDAWAFGLELAAELDRPAILEVWSSSQIAAVPRPREAGKRSHLAAVTAPCSGIAERVKQRIGAELTSLVPMGVSPPRQPRTVLADDSQPPSVAVMGGARDVSAYSAMLNGLARVMKDLPSLEVILELRGPHEHDIWRIAERAGIINAVSTIGSASHHHALLTRCDVVLYPERYGELRSVLLETMAMGLPVIAAADPALDMLEENSTARLIKENSPAAWIQAVSELLQKPADAQRLGAAGREKVLANHRSALQVNHMVNLLQRLVGTDAYAFPGPP